MCVFVCARVWLCVFVCLCVCVCVRVFKSARACSRARVCLYNGIETHKNKVVADKTLGKPARGRTDADSARLPETAASGQPGA